MPDRRRARLIAALFVLGTLAGCRSEDAAPAVPPRVAAPRVATRVRYQLGGPLRGANAPGAALSAQATSPRVALALDVTVLALAQPPRGWELAPLTSQSRVVMAEGESGDQLRATPRALETGRAGLVEQPLRALVESVTEDMTPPRGSRVLQGRACLVAGATTVIELVRDLPPGPGGVARRERAALLLGAKADGSSVDGAIEHEGEPGPPELVEVTTPLFAPSAPPATFVALVPSPFAGEETRWLAFVARPSPPPVAPAPGAAAHEEAVAYAVRTLAAQAQTAGLGVAPVAPPPELPDIDSTRRALADRAKARRGLYALAAATDAKTAEAIAIATDDPTLAPIASAVAAALGSATNVGKARDMGILVERATLVACRKALVGEPVPADLVAALEWRGGAALRLLPSFAADLEKAKSLDALEDTLVRLNTKLLLDASPTVRARAARWLGARMSLEGYSPIAPGVERRAAVERIKKKSAEAPRDRR